ncbi:MAG: NB-ARC domain-containing protein, partial [Chloroflexota bacterium]
MGKTRLALEVADQQKQRFTDGVYFISLQALIETDSIVAAIGSALKIEFDDNDDESLTEQLSKYLSTKEMLIVLDNFEHVLHNSWFVADVLVVAPRVKMLITSREALKLQVEWIHTVQGMRYPGNIYETNVNDYGAVQLFLERSNRYKRNLDVEVELPHIIRVCQLVGGMPLGIELAVAWLNTLSVEGIANELIRSVDLLTAQMRDISSRHKSIQVIFESTWLMLRENERETFMRLSIFRGIPTRRAIQAVTGASLLALSGLVDKALLIPTIDGRYQIHELLRQQAHEKLQESNDWDAIQQAHSEYYLRLLAEYQIDIYGRRQIVALDEIDSDFENIKLAWTWAVSRIRDDLISKSIEALCCYLHLRSRWKHDSHMVAEAQVAFTPKSGELPRRVWGMIAARNYMNNDKSITVLQEALQLAESYNDESEVGLCYFLLGSEYTYKQNFEEAVQYFEHSLPYLESVKDQYHLADAYTNLALGYNVLQNNKKASERIKKGLAISRTTGDVNG